VPPPAAPSAPTGPSAGWSPLWLLLPLLLAGGTVLLFRRRRRGAVQAEDAVEPAPAAAPEWLPATPLAASKPAARAPAAPTPSAALPPAAEEERAWLEVDFKPSRAAATDKEAIVHYELVLRNVGKTVAGNIRIDTKLFNAGAEAEIRDFLGGPIHDQSGSPHVTIPPGEELRLGSTIAMSKEDVREIVVEGRSLFVPAVAINVAYNWTPAGAGRTSKSWLVGREAEQPSQKMGAFRLDLGPRIYRSVGQRQTGLTQMV
jgi:hypothetical protein